MWFFGGKGKPTVKQVVTQLRLPDKGVTWKAAKKDLKRALPYITEEEVTEVQERFKHGGETQIRLSDKEVGLFKTLVLSSSQVALVPREEFTCCGRGVVCGTGCAMEVKSSKHMGPTDLGIVPVPVKGGGGDDFASEVAEAFTEVEDKF